MRIQTSLILILLTGVISVICLVAWFDHRLSQQASPFTSSLVEPSTRTTTPQAPQQQQQHGEDSFCVSWDTNLDEWWTHHVDYVVSSENATHQCFTRLPPGNDTAYLKEVYRNQFTGANCSEAFSWKMYNSGWSADLVHVAEGLYCAVGDSKPFYMSLASSSKRFPVPLWHYAALRHYNGSNATCPTRDMNCYFLPLSKCSTSQEYKTVTKYENTPDYHYKESLLLHRYITRQQQWLRKHVYDYLSYQNEAVLLAGGNCTVMHVRRGDVVLHARNSRQYFAIADYMDKLPAFRKANNATILLLTDDANAIDEALEFYPSIDWKYFQRPRFVAAEGGWENTAPSMNPRLEVVVILATLQLVRKCNAIVYGDSGFAKALLREMRAGNEDIEVYAVDGNTKVRKPEYVNSSLVLEERLEIMRKKKQGSY